MTPKRDQGNSREDVADVLVIGAGAAGLAAAAELARHQFKVVVLEARDRVGGRIFTKIDPKTQAPIELGAEFIHGLPPEIWSVLQSKRVPIHEVQGDFWCHRNGRICTCDFYSDVDDVLQQMDRDAPDESFASFLDRCCSRADDPKQREANRRATAYVSGFNAADPNRIGTHWLVDSMRAEEKIEGNRAFRAEHGYSDLLKAVLDNGEAAGVAIHVGTVVDRIAWRPDFVEVHTIRNEPVTYFGRRVIVTVPLSVLRSSSGPGSIQFIPELSPAKVAALQKLEMGEVIRVTFCFKSRFWDSMTPPDSDKSLADMSFLLSENDLFPTWWTTLPNRLPIITGWAPFRGAQALSGKDPDWMIERGLVVLAELMDTPSIAGELDSAYVHDWQSDSFSRGAYSYGLVGSDGAQEELALPMENTLFFAGEATDTQGQNGTVHGAIASGLRAASQIRMLRRS